MNLPETSSEHTVLSSSLSYDFLVSVVLLSLVIGLNFSSGNGWFSNLKTLDSVLENTTQEIHVLTKGFKWQLMLRQMRESMLRQTLHVHIASDTQKIQSSDWPKWRWAL